MAKKQASVYYKLGIDAMRGKLATKQKDIRYSGQSQDENTMALSLGKHESTNFDKYIVLTIRRGVNHFYVKSRTAIRNTIGSIYSKICLLLAMILVDRLYIVYKSGGGTTFTNSFDTSFRYWAEGKTVREYISSIVLQSIRNRQQNITYKGVPNAQGTSQTYNLCSNPFYRWNTQPFMIEQLQFPFFAKEMGMIQNNLQYFAAALNGVKHKIEIYNSVTGTKYVRYIVAEQDSTWAELATTIQYVVFGIDVDDQSKLSQIAIKDEEGNTILQGKPFNTSDLSSSIEVTQKIAETPIMYVGDTTN